MPDTKRGVRARLVIPAVGRNMASTIKGSCDSSVQVLQVLLVLHFKPTWTRSPESAPLKLEIWTSDNWTNSTASKNMSHYVLKRTVSFTYSRNHVIQIRPDKTVSVQLFALQTNLNHQICSTCENPDMGHFQHIYLLFPGKLPLLFLLHVHTFHTLCIFVFFMRVDNSPPNPDPPHMTGLCRLSDNRHTSITCVHSCTRPTLMWLIWGWSGGRWLMDPDSCSCTKANNDCPEKPALIFRVWLCFYVTGHSNKNSSINHWGSAVQTFWERWDQKTAHCAREARPAKTTFPLPLSKNRFSSGYQRSTFTVLQ